MPASRARAKARSKNEQQPSIVVFGVLGLTALTLIATVLRAPGFIVAWVGTAVIAFFEPPALLTGPKDKSGYPTPANDGEQNRLDRYQLWNDLKFKVLFPFPSTPVKEWGLLPGSPLTLSFAVAVLVAGFAAAVPPILPAYGLWLRIANALAAYVLICQYAASARRALACPGTRFDSLPRIWTRPGFLASIGLGLLLGGGFGYALLTYAPKYHWGSGPGLIAVAVLGGLLLLLAAIYTPWKREALEHWRIVREGDAEWRLRWDTMKQPVTPQMTDRQQVGPAQVDTFHIPRGYGSSAFLALSKQIAPTVGAGQRVAVLSVPDENKEGPMPGTVHPNRFQVVTWPVGEIPDLADPGTEEDVAVLLAHCCMFWVTDANSYARLVPTQISKITAPDSPRVAWASTWGSPGGLTIETLRDYLGTSALLPVFNCEVLLDPLDQTAFFGALTDPETVYAEDGPADAERMSQLAYDDQSDEDWKAVVKANPPVVQHSTRTEAELPNGVTVHKVGYVVRNGQKATDFFNQERALGNTSQYHAAPFIAITGWPNRQSGRPGERHPMAFTLYWSDGNPPEIKALAASKASPWVIAGKVNEAFSAVRLSRPEVISAAALTSRESRGHIWEVKLRHYDGVTMGDVRNKTERLRQALGVDWLRVAETEDGSILYIGAEPTKVELARSSRDMPRLRALDWNQAWLDTSVTGVGSRVPQLEDYATMPSNAAVEVLTFLLPPGLDITSVREKVGKLKNATSNEYVEIRPSAKGPNYICVIACAENPMPSRVGYDFEREIVEGDIPFATGIDGETIVWRRGDAPHLLFAGTSGPQPLTTRIPVPASEKYPTGWALMGDLAVGDEVYTATGASTTVTELHPIRELTLHTLRLSDGQSVECGPDHLWKASNASSRASYNTRSLTRHARVLDERLARAAEVRALADSTPLGTLASLDEIISIHGYQPLRQIVPSALAVRGFVAGRPTRLFRTADVASRVATMSNRDSARPQTVRLDGTVLPKVTVLTALAGAEEWLSLREITDLAMGRCSTRAERMSAKWWTIDAEHKDSTGLMSVDLYPVDEVLRIYADHIEYAIGRTVQPLETVVSATEMARSLVAPNYGFNWAVRVPAAVDGPDLDLAVPPYVLGAWLGDGRSDSGRFIQGSTEVCTDVNGLTDKDFLLAELVAEGIDASPYDSCDTVIGTRGLTTLLRAVGVLDNKHIPVTYLRASARQRLALLRGLMDTDGSIDANGSCELSLTDERLIHDALELIRSLGIKASINDSPAIITEIDPADPAQKRRRVTGTRWRIHFTTSEQVFRLPRKASRIKVGVRQTQDWLYVEDIVVSEKTVPMRCISVADTEHLYLTDGFVPTHNSGKSAGAQNILYGAVVSGCELVIIDPTKGAADFAFLRPYAKAIVGLDAEQDLAFHIIDAAATMKAVYNEGLRRRKLNSSYGVGSYLELPADIRPKPMIVFIDEFVGLIGMDKVQRTAFDDPEMEYERQIQLATNTAKVLTGQMASKIAAEARAWGIHLILGTQKLPAAMLDQIPNGSILKVNLARILLGKTTQGDRQSALRVPDEVPPMGDSIGKGRGVWEPLDASSQLIQTWYATQSQYTEALEARISPLTAEEMLDQAKYRIPMPVKEGTPEFGFPDETEEEEVIELGDMEFSLDDLGISPEDLDAEPESPEPDGPDAALPEGSADVGPATSMNAGHGLDVPPGADGATAQPFTLVLDVDGVLSPVDSTALEWDDVQIFEMPGMGRVARSETLMETLAGLTDSAVWLTQWFEDAPVFFPELGEAEVLTDAGTDEKFWWKTQRLMAWLDEHPEVRRLVWLDDQLVLDEPNGMSRREVAAKLLDRRDITTLMLSPRPQTGLTLGDMEQVISWVHEENSTSLVLPASFIAGVEAAPAGALVVDDFEQGPPAAAPVEQDDDFAVLHAPKVPVPADDDEFEVLTPRARRVTVPAAPITDDDDEFETVDTKRGR